MGKIKMTVNYSDSRLDVYITNNTVLTRSKVKKMFENNQILLNNKIPSKLGISVQQHDVIEILEQDLIEEDNIKLQQYKFDLDIKYEDEHFLIVNKPSGLLTHKTKFNELETLENALYNYLKNDQFKIVHRLDKHTSGLIIIAKDNKVYECFSKMMMNHEIEKYYYALAHNKLHDSKLEINIPIARSFQNKLKMQANKGKDLKDAKTIVSLIENYSNACLLECKLETGRTHQIRVHLKYINHPVINDPLYGIEKEFTDFNQYLVAYKLKFKHPINNKWIEISIELPNEFKELIEKLK